MYDTDSGFGQRQAITRQGLQAMQGLPASPFDDSSSHDSSGLQRRRRIVLGITIVALMLGGTFVFEKGFGRTLNQYWSGDTGYPSIEDAYKRIGSIDMVLERVHIECRSRTDFASRNMAKNVADATTREAFATGRAVTYLSCLASERPARFCQAAHRSHLLMAVRDYYRLMERMREELRQKVGILDVAVDLIRDARNP